MSSLINLQGLVACITGGTRGIGWTIAQLFAEHGATVVISGSSSQEIIDGKTTLLEKQFGGDHLGLRYDLKKPSNADLLIRDVFKKYKKVDVLVNNAGVLNDALLGMITNSVIDESLAVNMIAPIIALQAASKLMRRTGSGSIINMASIIGTHGNSGQSVYAASKAGIIGLTKSAAKELAGYGIRVNAIAPGFIDTDMTKSLPREKYEERMESICMGRIGRPEDVAHVALFLASRLSQYVTGQVIGVDGGMVI